MKFPLASRPVRRTNRFPGAGLAFALALAMHPCSASTEVESACKRISGKLASVSFSECHTLDMRPSGHLSVEGFPLLVKEYPPLESREPRGRILLVGGTHGDKQHCYF